MSETAVEMPEIKKDNQSEGALAGIMGATIFFLGITGKALLFYRQL